MRIDPVLDGTLRVACLCLTGAAVETRDHRVGAELARVAGSLRGAYRDLRIGSIPGAVEARALFRALGIDPTRHRPSSEALLRRALKGRPLPAINSAVDTANLVSLETLLPVGLYDRARIAGEVSVRLGRPGEQYQGIGEDEVHLEGRITLADEQGAFGNPTRDSLRTCVTAASADLLFILFAPRDRKVGTLFEMLSRAEQRFLRFVGGEISDRAVLPADPVDADGRVG